MILIYCDNISPRIKYICDFFWSQYYELTSDKSYFAVSSIPKINYSEHKITLEEFKITPHGLLNKSNIQPQRIDLKKDKSSELAYFFATENGHLNFDFLAMAFYLISRYEEYTSPAKDKYGRFDYKKSIAFQHQFLRIPLIDFWWKKFLQKLQLHFPNYAYNETSFQFTPSFDIDLGFQYKHKRWIHRAGGIAKNLLQKDWAELKNRWQVMRHQMQDPFDVYNWLTDISIEFKPLFFILSAAKPSKYDHNISLDKKAFSDKICALEKQFPNSIQIHPSFQSFGKPKLIADEKKKLEQVVGRTITQSRQHFLKWQVPETFQNIVNAGISDDYSMGYGAVNGYRASTSKAFYWFDLSQNAATHLRIHPFCFMDATAIDNQNMTAEMMYQEMRYFSNLSQQQALPMTFIFHNHLLANNSLRNPYRIVVEKIFQEINNQSDTHK